MFSNHSCQTGVQGLHVSQRMDLFDARLELGITRRFLGVVILFSIDLWSVNQPDQVSLSITLKQIYPARRTSVRSHILQHGIMNLAWEI